MIKTKSVWYCAAKEAKEEWEEEGRKGLSEENIVALSEAVQAACGGEHGRVCVFDGQTKATSKLTFVCAFVAALCVCLYFVGHNLCVCSRWGVQALAAIRFFGTILLDVLYS